MVDNDTSHVVATHRSLRHYFCDMLTILLLINEVICIVKRTDFLVQFLPRIALFSQIELNMFGVQTTEC